MISGYPYFRKPPDTCTQGKPIKMYHTQYIPDGDGERERERERDRERDRERERRYVHRLHAPAHYIRSHSVALPSIRLPCATLHTCLALHCIHTSISFHSISFSSIPFHFICFISYICICNDTSTRTPQVATVSHEVQTQAGGAAELGRAWRSLPARRATVKGKMDIWWFFIGKMDGTTAVQ